MSDKPTHTPEALYSCRICAEDVSWPAGDLNWCERSARSGCVTCAGITMSMEKRESDWITT